MEKRYQVFISSTFTDLKDARQEVSKALLRSDCFPAQMEQWPATDEEQFEVIKQIIQQCDYYIVISAGMYGSINPHTGLSYTEMEFDYAQQLGVPIIRLLHLDPFKSLLGSQIESSGSAREKLVAFRRKLQDGKLCAFWKTSEELGREVILSLNDIKKRKPAQGWVRASEVAASDAVIEIANLKQEVSELKLKLAKASVDPDVEAVLEELAGSISLTEYELSDEAASSWRTSGISIGFRDREYYKTEVRVEVARAQVARGIMYGLLYSTDVQTALSYGLASLETDETGCPLRICDDVDLNELDDLFMFLEAKGIVVSGDRIENVFRLLEHSFAKSYPWSLSRFARNWILSSKTRRA